MDIMDYNIMSHSGSAMRRVKRRIDGDFGGRLLDQSGRRAPRRASIQLGWGESGMAVVVRDNVPEGWEKTLGW